MAERLIRTQPGQPRPSVPVGNDRPSMPDSSLKSQGFIRRPHSLNHRFYILGVAAILATGIAGCAKENAYQPPPPQEVVVAYPVKDSVRSHIEQTGTAQASGRVELRARVKGFLKQRKFKDGDAVKAEQLLFVIDEEPFKIKVQQSTARQSEAEAMLAKAQQSKAREISEAQLKLDEAELALAKIQERRTRELFATKALTREDLDRSEAALKKVEAQVLSDQANFEQAKADYDSNILTAQAMLDAAKADVEMAKVDLGYCRITSPIDGLINAREFDEGNYVGEGLSTVLATVVKVDPIYAFITPNEGDLGRILAGHDHDYRTHPIPMELGLGSQSGYPLSGKVDYIDPSVDTGTGTIRVRGTFDNDGLKIKPGLFVRIRIPAELQKDVLLVPDKSLGEDQGGSYVLVVGEGEKVVRRTVVPGIEVDGMRVVSGSVGLQDRVVVDGLLRARPGAVVKPTFEKAAAAAVTAKASRK